jgi:hypothetical protein
MSLSIVDEFDPSIYEQHGRDIGRCTATLLETLHKFVTFMKTQKLTSHQMNQAASALHKGLSAVKSSKNSGASINNICCLVWSVLKRRNFELLCLNHSENLKRNRISVGGKKTALRSCIDQLQISESDTCYDCKDGGLLVLCEKCKLAWHVECAPPAGHLLDLYLKTVKKWFCFSCIKSGSEMEYYKKPRIQPSTVELSSIVATGIDSASVVTTPEALVVAASNIITNTHEIATSVVCNSLVPAVVSVSSNSAIFHVGAIGDATSSQSAPVASALVLPTTAAKLSEKLSMLSMKLMQVSQPTEQAYQTYLNDIESFLSRISQQLDADSTFTTGVDAADSALVKTGIQALPSFCKGLMTESVQSQSPKFEEFGDCISDNNVGSCKVFRVTTLATDGSHPYDSLALEINKEMFYVNNLCTSANERDNSVTISEPGMKTSLTFSSVSAEFLSWALARMPKNLEQTHFSWFEQNAMVRVECGGSGNCFFTSCLFLLKVEVPDFTFKMARPRQPTRGPKARQQDMNINLSKATHVMLRQATCQHLRQHFAEIRLSDGIAILDTIKKQANSDQALSDEDIIGGYCDHFEQAGIWVENAVVVAFAHFCQVSLSIFHISHAEPYPVSHPQPVHTLAKGSGLYCNEMHYQASMYIYINIDYDIYIHVCNAACVYSTSCSSQAVVPANKIFKLGDDIRHFVNSASLTL